MFSIICVYTYMLKITIGENTTHEFEGEWWGYMRNVLYLTSNLKIKQKRAQKQF